MQTIDARWNDGLILLTLEGGEWILDTGAPISFGEVEKLTLDGELFSIERNYLGMDIAALSHSMGISVNGLLGMDVLSEMDLLIDLPAGEVTISMEALTKPQNAIEIEHIMGVPLVFAALNGVEYRMLIDSGAEIGYLFEDSVAGLSPRGQFTDMLPMYGMFDTVTYELDSVIRDVALGSMTFGTLPEKMAVVVRMANVDGLIGNALFQQRKVGISSRASKLWFA